MSSGETLEDLKITREEFDRITDAMKQEEFRKLFIEYCEEISDPENRKKYEDEIKQLESQRGVDCKFVHPHPGFVIKTTDGAEKVFINVAKNDLVDRPSYENVCNEGKNGMNWSLPLIQAPVRKDMDKKGQWCHVYDVIFHPETLEIAERDGRFRQMVVQTAVDAVVNAYKVDLDKTNLRFPKMDYKGMAKPTVIRKKNEKEETGVDMGPLTDIMPPLPMKKEKVVHTVKEEISPPEYTTPKYTIKYRKHLEMHEFTQQIDAKMNSSVPNEILIEIQLPLLRAASEAVLDVSPTRLYLCSETPAKYQLEIKLSHEVDDKEGNACFNKEKRVLSVTLPIVRKNIGVVEIEKTQKAKVEVLSESVNDEIVDNGPSKAVSEEIAPFFDPKSIYEAPDFYITSFDGNNVRFIIETPNISPDSILTDVINEQCYLKFESLGDGFFPVAYGTIIDFDDLIVSANATMTSDELLLLELELKEIVEKDQTIFYYGPPAVERDRYRLRDVYDPNKIREAPVQEEIHPVLPTPIDFEFIRNLKLEG